MIYMRYYMIPVPFRELAVLRLFKDQKSFSQLESMPENNLKSLLSKL